MIAGAKRKPMPSLRRTNRSHRTDAAMPPAMSTAVAAAQTGT
jgi:hypothetical protein